MRDNAKGGALTEVTFYILLSLYTPKHGYQKDCSAAFEEQHRAELTAHRAAAAYLKANNITELPSPKKLEAEYAQLASEKAKFYEQYKEAKEELLKLKTAKQNVALFFREEEPAQQER